MIASSPLRELRKQQGLRLVDVAERAGCAPSLVSMIENGYTAPEATLERIYAAVGLSDIGALR